MTREELQALIDRVIGKKGILRTPSYWMKKVLNSIVDYCEGLTPKIEVEAEVNDSENPVQSKAVKGYVDTAIQNVEIDVETEVNDSGNPVSSAAVKGYVDNAIGDINITIGDIDAILDNINGEVK